MRWLAAALLLGVALPAMAERRTNGLSYDCAVDCGRNQIETNKAQIQADVGLAVIGLAFELPLTDHVSLQIEAQIFGTYFLPWFSAGTKVQGYGGQLRPTWFRRGDQHGLYLAVPVRVDRVSDDTSHATGFCAGAVAGWAFRLTRRLDLRLGGGAQYMRYKSGTIDIATPFVALDAVVGYRL
ncbi:MAG: hypothetical protein JWO36_2120 [Myxococcales bacterium]|nr:hypothetical protein [Myxococcales bacterium]